MKIKHHSLSKNTAANLANHLVAILLPIITFPYVCRILQPTILGRVNFIQSIATYFILLGSLGIMLYGTRAITQARDSQSKLAQTTAEIFIIHILLTLVGIAALILFAALSKEASKDLTLLLICSIPLLLSPIAMEHVFAGLEQFVFTSARTVTARILAVTAIFLCVKTSEDYRLYALINALVVGAPVINVIFMRKFFSLKMIDWRALRLKRHIKPIVVLALTTVAHGIYAVTDKVMLGYMSSDTEVGYYVVAQKLVMIVIGLIVSAVAVLLPRTSYLCQTRQHLEQHREKLTLYFSLVMILSVASIGGVLLFAKSIVSLFAGPEYSSAIPIAQICIISVPAIALHQFILYQFTYPTGKDWVACIALFTGTTVNIILNFVLIPHLQGVGAGIATFAAQVATCVAAVYLVRRDFMSLLRPVLARWVKTTLCAAAALLPISLLTWRFGNIALIPAFFAAYLILLAFLLAKTNDQGLHWLLEKTKNILHHLRSRNDKHKGT